MNSTDRPPSNDPEAKDRAAIDSEDESAPRWVKVLGIVALVVIVIVVIIHLAGGGLHGHSMQ